MVHATKADEKYTQAPKRMKRVGEEASVRRNFIGFMYSVFSESGGGLRPPQLL
jgi:hypothetical protein|tara:strand:- start:312 stop:470 length:159 start_codon:yes stop_codon:yes gene_type:complete